MFNTFAGAVTWSDGMGGTVGIVNADNSLIGTQPLDDVGIGGLVPLPNGNYVVQSPNWAYEFAHNMFNGAAGAATWADGTVGVIGILNADNSLIGTQAGDTVGAGFFQLPNGNYITQTQNWSFGGNAGAGAVTWADQAVGVIGFVSADNSLVETQAGDNVGNPGILALSNGTM